MIVSFCIVARNEQEYLPKLFEDICNQTYPHSLIELVLVDSVSTDSTYNLMNKFKLKNTDFKNIIIITNEKKTQSSGWNLAIQKSTGELIMRIDGHSSVPKDFVRNNVTCIESGEDISGGTRANIVDGDTFWKKSLLLAERSMFGSSIAPYRRKGEKKYVKSMFHATYKREVFETVGGFNEKLGRTEDNEIHYRMRKAGYKLCFNPNIISFQFTRPTLKKMILQKYKNGYWIGLTTGISPKCLSWYHFVPLLFVIGIFFTSILFMFDIPEFGIIMWVSYCLSAIIMSILAFSKNGSLYTLIILPFLFFLLHISYGIGTIVGLLMMPMYAMKNKR